ncbi:hypothetical protein A0256_10520 [Mucilaginibacter sp. PAMC 26640]|nr:hypothetical protein A0256_10520 [Mucilaginibacter sp. PAMC 26640]
MPAIHLSLIIATRNRLPFLKINLMRLIAALQPGEEIVVVDANSNDGAQEFLQELYDADKIHQFISEPDHNQAHGWNKALLMAKGTIIKKIIDDDVYSLPDIRKCCNFMLENPATDICISNSLTTILTSDHIATDSRLKYYQAWRDGKTPCFSFGDAYMLIRKSALSYLGLFDTQFAMMDWEYSLRCSYLQANIAYYTGYNSMSVHTPGNVTSSTNGLRLKKEGEIGRIKYGYAGDRSDISLYSEIKIAIGKAINYQLKNQPIQHAPAQIPAFDELNQLYNKLYESIADHNSRGDFSFIAG